MKIGVFDSGIGGLSVANAIGSALPEHEIVFRNDSEHVPYGNRRPAELFELVLPILQEMVDEGCALLVIACNTVSTTISGLLREQLSVPVIAMEPMIKPAAAATKSGVIGVCATPATLASKRYQELKQSFAADITVLEPDCSDWAAMIEHDLPHEHHIAKTIEKLLEKQADVIVLGCTHYHWIEDEINALVAGKAAVMQPEPAIIQEVKRQLEKLDHGK